MKFVDDTKLGGPNYREEGQNIIQESLNAWGLE